MLNDIIEILKPGPALYSSIFFLILGLYLPWIAQRLQTILRNIRKNHIVPFFVKFLGLKGALDELPQLRDTIESVDRRARDLTDSVSAQLEEVKKRIELIENTKNNSNNDFDKMGNDKGV